jgi:hypothetical protein
MHARAVKRSRKEKNFRKVCNFKIVVIFVKWQERVEPEVRAAEGNGKTQGASSEEGT